MSVTTAHFPKVKQYFPNFGESDFEEIQSFLKQHPHVDRRKLVSVIVDRRNNRLNHEEYNHKLRCLFYPDSYAVWLKENIMNTLETEDKRPQQNSTSSDRVDNCDEAFSPKVMASASEGQVSPCESVPNTPCRSRANTPCPSIKLETTADGDHPLNDSGLKRKLDETVVAPVESEPPAKRRCGLDVLALVACDGVVDSKQEPNVTQSNKRSRSPDLEDTTSKRPRLTPEAAVALDHSAPTAKAPAATVPTVGPSVPRTTVVNKNKCLPNEKRYYQCLGCSKWFASHKARFNHCVKSHEYQARRYLNDLHHDINEIMGLPVYMNKETRYVESLYTKVLGDLPGGEFFPVEVQIHEDGWTASLGEFNGREDALAYLQRMGLRNNITGTFCKVERTKSGIKYHKPIQSP